MKYITFVLVFLSLGFTCTKEEIEKMMNGPNSLSKEEVVAGLKQALSVGTDTSVALLSKTDGYYKDALVKIMLPDEAKSVYTNIGKVPGGQKLLDNTVMAINRAAEDAAKEAKPIFINAITSMSIADGFAILKGGDNAATNYLKSKTSKSLFDKFKPKIQQSLSKPLVLGASAEGSYKNLITAYNTASLNGMLYKKITTTSLSEHVTQKALDGLFAKVALQESKIRNNPVAQVTDLLKKVFGRK